MTYNVIDTNVLVAANRDSPQASDACIEACSGKLLDVREHGIVVIDDQWRILSEYENNVATEGQLREGSIFLKWLLRNHRNRSKCHWIPIEMDAEREFREFPDEPALAGFDRADRKFVAVALTHPRHPSILNALDWKSWWQYRHELAPHGIHIDFLCPDAMPADIL